MSTVEKIKALAARLPDTEVLETEEATKNALVMPFIAALGYDVFDPLEVVPEFTADVATKKGEKVDYAIKSGDEIIILVECKRATESLSDAHLGQLFRYFSVTHARIALLTNGFVFRFYSDLEDRNKMDQVPFLEIDLRSLKEPHLRELAKLGRESFDLDHMLSTASDLKYTNLIRKTLERQFDDPDEEFAKFFFGATNPSGRFGKNAREQFKRLVKRALHEAVTDRVSLRLRSALQHEETKPEAESQESNGEEALDEGSEAEGAGSEVVTTEEELDGYRIVKAIVCGVLPPERVAFRDAKTYFSVLCDDNNRKPICRLHFNTGTKYLGLLDDEKQETRHKLETVEALYGHAEQLREAASRYI